MATFPGSQKSFYATGFMHPAGLPSGLKICGVQKLVMLGHMW